MKTFFLPAIVLTVHAAADDCKPWWPDSVESALVESGENRAELASALATVPAAQRHCMKFLIENMPPPDLRNLTAAYLLENTALACEALAAAPWAKQVPPDIFLNDILPYASLNESRDNGRRRLREIAAPLVKDCKTPGEAAQTLNRQLFGKVNVRYSTARKKPHQSARESMESGIASCSGLAILLVDACRAVGVPARVAGTPMWTNMRGNHTWIEVWDGGWHFAGAAEPDPNGLDRGWFCGDASRAQRDVPKHAIYASSFRKTGLSFPLVWNRRIDWVPAVNVTDRYAPATAPAGPDQSKIRLLVRVLNREGGQRVAAKVTLTDPADASVKLDGTSRDESADRNNILPFSVTRGHEFKLRVEAGGKQIKQSVKTIAGTAPEQTVTILLGK
jgi:transglutaminase-like putative cysteine protease